MQALERLATMPAVQGFHVAGRQTYSEADRPGPSARQMPFGGGLDLHSEAEFLAQLGERVRTSRML